MQPWKTETVSLLLTGILEEKAWDRYPILADALEEAGYDDREVLDCLRTESLYLTLDGPWVERVLSGAVRPVEVRESRQWMVEFADKLREYCKSYAMREYDYDDNGDEIELDEPRYDEDLDHTPEALRCCGQAADVRWVMDVCDNYIGYGDVYYSRHYFFGFDTPDFVYESSEDLWKHYGVLTGTPPQTVTYQNYGGETVTQPASPFRCAC